MAILAVIPTTRELEALVSAMAERGQRGTERLVGRMPTIDYGGRMVLARGGLGKAQLAAATQHLIDHLDGLALVVCAGTAGGLADDLEVGDVVVGEATVEHDFRWGVPERELPRFEGHADSIASLDTASLSQGSSFRVILGLIASGDEAVIDSARAEQIRAATGAAAVAFEGAGGARACQLSDVPFLEVRGISDKADEAAPQDFDRNLPLAMRNVGVVLDALAAMSE